MHKHLLGFLADGPLVESGAALRRDDGRVSEQLLKSRQAPSTLQPTAGKCVPELVDAESLDRA